MSFPAPPRPSSAGLAVLLKLAWPIVLSRAAQAVIGFSDAAMVAPRGEAALAATTTGALNTLSVLILPTGLVFIVQSFASQLHGQGDSVGARRYAWAGLAVSALTGLLAVLALPLVDAALAPFGYEPSVRALMADYIRIRLLSVGPAVAVEAIGNYYAGLGNTRIAMAAGVLMMVVNVGLNALLIGGALGLPALGVRGAAIASAVASFVGFACVLAVFLRDPAARNAKGPRFRAAELRRTLRFGLPNGLNWFFEFAAFALFVNVIVANLGTTALAAIMAVMQVNSVAFMPGFGLASAGAILVGQAIGAGNPGAASAIVRRTALVAGAWQGLVGLGYLLAPGPLMSLFATESERGRALGELAARLLVLSAAWQLFDALSMTLSEALRAAGDTAYCLALRLALAWLVWLPLAYLAVHRLGGGPEAAILCVVAYLAALSGALLLRFRSGAWRRIDLTGGAPRASAV